MKTNLKTTLVAGTVTTILAAAASLGVAPAARASMIASPCPNVGTATAGCDLIITLNNNGTATLSTGPSASIADGTYDGSDDTLIGVINNSGATVGSIHLSSSNDIFGFEGDGISVDPNPISGLAGLGLAGDTGPSHGSGYSGTDSISSSFDLSGPLNSFTVSDNENGNVNFGTGLVAGGSAFFSLEGQLSTADFTATPGTTVPEPGSLAMFFAGLAALAGFGWLRRRRTAS